MNILQFLVALTLCVLAVITDSVLLGIGAGMLITLAWRDLYLQHIDPWIVKKLKR